MSTKRDQLQNTVREAEQLWRVERQIQRKNAVNEGAWSVQVIEPILASLDWGRLPRRALNGTGAYFEWPTKHKVDVALLNRGVLKAFMELKDKHVGRQSCRNDLGKKLVEHLELREARVGVAAWFAGDAGFCAYEIQPDGSLVQGAIIRLSDASRDAKSLAELAAPVLIGQTDAIAWLNSEVFDSGPVAPRCRPRDIQKRFFELLGARLKPSASLKPRFRYKDFNPPTPTYAFTELPGILPSDSGLVFDFDNTMNQLQCFFYCGGNRKVGGTGKWSFDELGMNDSVLESFLSERVLPEIDRRRRGA